MIIYSNLVAIVCCMLRTTQKLITGFLTFLTSIYLFAFRGLYSAGELLIHILRRSGEVLHALLTVCWCSSIKNMEEERLYCYLVAIVCHIFRATQK